MTEPKTMTFEYEFTMLDADGKVTCVEEDSIHVESYGDKDCDHVNANLQALNLGFAYKQECGAEDFKMKLIKVITHGR